MKIGITGTRYGMNSSQRTNVNDVLVQIMTECKTLNETAEFHHGDCVGVDVEAAAIAKELGYVIVCHPPSNNDLRGNFYYDVTHEPTNHFARNRRIVDHTDALLVVPYQDTHQKRGGTWYTHDYAVKVDKPLFVFYPKG
jgi:hypothetical protein